MTVNIVIFPQALQGLIKKKLSNRAYKRKIEVKRRRKHGQLARTKQQIFDEQVDLAKKMDTYQAGVAVLGQSDNNHTQQSSSQSTTKRRSDNICENVEEEDIKRGGQKLVLIINNIF